MYRFVSLTLVLLASIAFANERPDPDAPPSPPAADPSPAEDAELAKRLDAIDARAAKIEDFTADFRQEKFTALLRKPLVSSGTVRVKGATIRWDTKQPEPVVLHSDGREFRVHYPKQKVLEIYPIDRRLGDLAASPLPRLATLREHFSIRQISTEELAGKTDAAEGLVALELTPTDEALAEHVEAVRVLLEVDAAHIVKVETVDADGDRTVITFGGVRTNTGINEADLALTVPEDTKVSRPLEGVEGR